MAEQKKMAGYPSIDKPWLKYYSDSVERLALPMGSMYQYLVENNSEDQDDIAISYFNSNISYEQLFYNIRCVSKAFQQIGVKKGDIVSILLPNIPENIYCIYALNRIGAVADMIDLRSKGDALIHYLKNTESKCAVVIDLFCKNVFEIIDQTSVKHVIIISPFDSMKNPYRALFKMKRAFNNIPGYAVKWTDFCKYIDPLEYSDINGTNDDIACIFHTSGTTGFPKGVMCTNLNANSMALQGKWSNLRFERCKRIMNQVPPFLAFNVLCSMHLPLVQHMRMVLLPEYRPDLFAKNIVKTKASCCLAGPADWGNFLENPDKLEKKSLMNLINPICGSDALSTDARKKINKVLKEKGCEVEILEGYGMTEIGSAASCNMPGHVVDESVGIPFCFNNFCIYDNDSGEELSYNEVGEICMTGPTVMKGYYKNDSETNEVLRIHNDGRMWLHSGDLGRIDEDGNIYLEGRLKRIIIRYDGIKVSPYSIERVVSKIDGIKSCCAVGLFDDNHGRGYVPVVFFETELEQYVAVESIKKECEEQLSRNYLPHYYYYIEKMPLTPNNKVDYRALEKLAEEQING